MTKTRFAPSPTGRMHVGNLRTALYSYLIARHDGGKFMLRIEDTDQERFVEEALPIIHRTLRLAGLSYDEGPDRDGGVGPYVQSERCREGIYREYAEKLIESGHAYRCFCSHERLEELRNSVAGKDVATYDKHCLRLSPEEIQEKLDAGCPYVIRFNMPTEGETSFHDEIFGDITVNNEELDDLILVKSDGYPTYNFANVVDDHLMGVTHVVRGSEYLSSTPKYNRIYEAFGWEVPVYIHCPLITDESGQKLSKRSGHASFEDLLEAGFLPEAVVNFVALLGWSPADEREIFSLDELAEVFDYRHINKAPAAFDMTKLAWMNGEYMKNMDDARFRELALPFLKETLKGDYDLEKIADMVKTRIQVIPDIAGQVDFLDEMPEYDAELYVHKKSKSTLESSLNVLTDILPKLQETERFDNDSLFAVLSDYANQKEYKINTVMWPVRLALSGKAATPAGATGLMELLGKEESLARVRAAIEKIGSLRADG